MGYFKITGFLDYFLIRCCLLLQFHYQLKFSPQHYWPGGENEYLIIIVFPIVEPTTKTINYFIGFGGNKLFKKLRKKQNKKDVQDESKSHKILDKFGWGAVFLASWIPILGDIILISAGVKKMKFTKFVLFMMSGKIVKSIIVVIGLGIVF